MNDENKFSLYCSVMDLRENVPASINKIVDSDLDWRYIINNVKQNGVFLRFFLNLHYLGIIDKDGLIPSRIIQVMRGHYYTYIGQSMVSREEAKTVFRKLAVDGIQFMPIKGLLLAETVYKDRYSRSFNDIDLLFPTLSDRERAEKILVRLGYIPKFRCLRESGFEKVRRRTKVLFNTQSFVGSIFHFFEYPLLRNVWECSSRIKLEALEVTAMSPEHSFLTICLNSFREGKLVIKDLSDILEILQRYQKFDWEFISRLAEEEELQRFLFVPLQLINSLGSILIDRNILPKKVLDVFQDGMEEFRIGQKEIASLVENDNLHFPIFFASLCHNCNICVRCPLLIHKLTHPSLDALPMSGRFTDKKIWRTLCEYYYILNYVKRDYGGKYALNCLLKETRSILEKIIDKVGEKSISGRILKS